MVTRGIRKSDTELEQLQTAIKRQWSSVPSKKAKPLTAIKSSELRHHNFNELGATKLACVWVLEHLGKTKSR
jgi:hypothetical protein